MLRAFPLKCACVTVGQVQCVADITVPSALLIILYTEMGYPMAAAQVWCVAVSAAGDFAVSGGADRSLRVWRRTEEPFFVEEERERRLESLFEADAEARRAAHCAAKGSRLCGAAAEYCPGVAEMVTWQHHGMYT